jgi:hypothetical protein
MRRGLCFSVGILLFAGICLAQQVAVQIPNGTEHWKKGDTQQIKWSCTPCMGTAELHLVKVPARTIQPAVSRAGYQEIGVIKASIPITPTSQFYSFNWKVGDYYGGSAAVGGGYKVLVKIVTASTTISDISDTDFVIGAPPTIDTFAINGGRSVTNQRRVTLNYTFSGFPVPGTFRVRCTPRPGTLGMWTPMPNGSYPTYDLPQESGNYTIELWLANDLGSGPSKTDTIRYDVPPPPGATQDYTVQASSIACPLYFVLNPAWYGCKCTSYSGVGTPQKSCSCISDGSIYVELKDSTVVGGSPVTSGQGVYLGSKAEYEFFGGHQLNEGWSFVSIRYSDGGSRDGAGSAILIMPQLGSRSILLKVRLWTDGGTTSHTRTFYVTSLVIRGPVGRPVSEAFK